MKIKELLTSSRTLAITAIVLAFAVFSLFREVLQPNYCLFSNDAPLGLVQSSAGRAATSDLTTGFWSDLNWIGSQSPSIAPCPSWLLYQFWRSAVLNSKLHAPVALIVMGLAASLVAGGLRFRAGACILAGLAAALASNPVSYACWGLPGKALTLAANLAAVYFINMQSKGLQSWLRFVLAGFAVGLGVMEGGDVGAILSLYVGCYVIWRVFWDRPAEDPVYSGAGRRLMSGFTAAALVAVCAGWIACHSLFTLVSTQLQGDSASAAEAQNEAKKWDFATGWSMPIGETWRVAVPGLFGYRMDTPGGGAYWGGVGPDGSAERRFSGSGEYVGILVLLVAVYAVANSLRKTKSPFSADEKRQIWFWAVAAILSLLISYGRFAPFYYAVFKLPYFSNIRIPMKFLHAMNLSLWILFAFGLEAIGRLHFDGLIKRGASPSGRWADWKRSAQAFDRRWLFGIWIAFGLALAGSLMYTAATPAIERYLAGMQFQETQPATATFSVVEVWKTVAFFGAFVGLLTWACIGASRPGRSLTFWWILGLVLAADLIRADRPWVKVYDYKARYQTNGLFDVLRERPWENRVTAYLVPQRAAPLVATKEFGFLHKEWLENQFQYYDIQSLDIDQMPRMPDAEQTFLRAFQPPELGYGANLISHLPELGNLSPEQAGELKAVIPKAQAGLLAVRRLWEVTNTRYMLGWAAGIEMLNDLLDPEMRRFKIKIPYTLQLKAGSRAPSTNTPIADAVQAYTAIPNDRGPLALIEFTGALPRAKFYSQWETITNRESLLNRLAAPSFDPAKSLLLSDSVSPPPARANSQESGDAVTIESYAPKRIVLKCHAATPGVVLLNDRWNEFWRASIDGKSVPILNANFLMRAVKVDGGEHTIEFKFVPPVRTLWITLSAFVTGIAVAGILAVKRAQP